MTYALIGWGSFVDAYGSNLTPSLPGGTSVGNLGILVSGEFLGTDAAPTVSGWTNISPQVNAKGLNVWARILTGSGDAPTVPAWANWGWAICGAYSGNPSSLTGITVASADQFSNNVSSASYYSGTFTVPQDNCLLLAVATFNKTTTRNSATWNSVPHGSFTIEAQKTWTTSADFMAVINDVIQTTATSLSSPHQTTTISDCSSQAYSTILLALAAAGAPSPYYSISESVWL